MRRYVVIVLLVVMIISETIILNNQNKVVEEINTSILKELKENNLIKDDEVILEEVKKEKKELEEKVNLVFKEVDIEKAFSEQKQIEESLNKEVTELENEIIALELSLSNLEQEYNKLVKENEEKNTFYITGVPFINQYPNYPTGCESVALTILLNYYGVLVTPDDIISELPKGSVPYTENGITYGGNPEVEFIGSPYSLNSYGVYEKPLAEVANKYKPGINIATGTSFSQILDVVRRGRPVIVWTSMNLATPYISKSWIYEKTGETIYWKANEHAVVIIGYTNNKVIISDPIGGQMKYQSLSVFEERYNYYGKKALYY